MELMPAKMFTRFIISFLFLTLLSAAAANVSSQSSQRGVTIQPFLQNISFRADEPIKSLTVEVKNQTSSVYEFKAVAVDFGSLDETGGLIFAGARADKLIAKYGLAKWLVLDSSTRRLPPGASTQIRAEIDNRPDLAPGGHYAAIVLTAPGASAQDIKSAQISLKTNIASLIFANKQGGEIYRMKLTEVNESHSLFKLPSKVSLRFKNEGNTHLVPRGSISLSDASGKLVGRGVINEASSIIMPEKSRRYDVALRKVDLATRPGKYSLTINYRFEGVAGFRTYQKSILLLTPAGVVAALLAAAALAGGIYYLYRKKHLKNIFSRLKNRIKK